MIFYRAFYKYVRNLQAATSISTFNSTSKVIQFESKKHTNEAYRNFNIIDQNRINITFLVE